MIRDRRGKIPNYVIVENRLTHQWTGKFVMLADKSPLTIARALAELRKKVATDA